MCLSIKYGFVLSIFIVLLVCGTTDIAWVSMCFRYIRKKKNALSEWSLGQKKKKNSLFECLAVENTLLDKKFIKTSSPKGNDRSPVSNVQSQIHLKLAWRHHFPIITLWNIFQTLKGH